MIVDEAIAMLESSGVTLAINQGGNLALTFQIGYERSNKVNNLLETLKANKKQVIDRLQARNDYRQGFAKAEAGFDPITVHTCDIHEAVAIGEAIRKGQAVLDGKVVYDPRLFMTVICYRPLVPPEWMDIPKTESEKKA